MSVVYSVVILYAKYLAKTLCMVRCRYKNVPRPDQSDVVPAGTVPVPVPVLSTHLRLRSTSLLSISCFTFVEGLAKKFFPVKRADRQSEFLLNFLGL